MAKFCGKCGTALTEGTKFCAKCGAPVEKQNTYTANTTPTFDNTDQAFIENVKRDFFSYEGRLNRKPYIMRMLILVGILIAAMVFLDMDNSLAEMIGLVLVIGVIIADFMLSIRRAHDLDKNGFIVLLTYVPVVGMLIAAYLLIVPGTKGDNQYGSDPSEGEW